MLGFKLVLCVHQTTSNYFCMLKYYWIAAVDSSGQEPFLWPCTAALCMSSVDGSFATSMTCLSTRCLNTSVMERNPGPNSNTRKDLCSQSEGALSKLDITGLHCTPGFGECVTPCHIVACGKKVFKPGNCKPTVHFAHKDHGLSHIVSHIKMQALCHSMHNI